jgi:hypothetical protein
MERRKPENLEKNPRSTGGNQLETLLFVHVSLLYYNFLEKLQKYIKVDTKHLYKMS